MSEPDLPRTDGGSIDWERAFEDPEQGFIPLVLHAETVADLRVRALEVAERLHNRTDDPLEIDKFIELLNHLIPDTVSNETLHHVSGVVASLLRQMKAHRLQAARHHRELRQKSLQAERRRAKIEEQQSRKTRRLVVAISLVVVVVIASVITYEILSQPGATADDKMADQLLDQMKEAAKTGAPQGAIVRVETIAGRQAVVVSGLPQGACFDTAWGLVNQGTILINGLGSPRLSPTIIRDLCSQSGDRSTITWMPK